MTSTFCMRNQLRPGKVLPLLAVLGLGTLLAAGCGREDSANGPAGTVKPTSANAPRVQTIAVQLQNLSRSIEMPGTVEGYETAELYAKVGGYLEEILVDIGDQVEKDQPLAKIHVPEMLNELDQKQAAVVRAEAGVEQSQAGIRQAEANLAIAEAGRHEAQTEKSEKEALRQFRQAEYDRVKGLVESGALTGRRLDEATFQLDAAKAVLKSVDARIRAAEAKLNAAGANVDKAKADTKTAQAQLGVASADREKAQTMLQYATIRAPFDGVVLKRWVHPGAFIQPAEGNSAAKPLLTVTRIDVVRVFVDLPMAEVRLLDREDRVVLDRINVLPGEKFEGPVARFSPSLDVSSRMMRVEIDLKNPQNRLLPGYYGYVTLFLQELPDTPVVPSSALLTDGSKTFVYVVEDGICRKRAVSINYQDGTIVGIASGLSRGEQVVRAGGGQLTDGQAVVPVADKTE